MRSELVFNALTFVPNRYQLTKLAAYATRRFHKPNTRIADTANDVLDRFGKAHPILGSKHNGKQVEKPLPVESSQHRGTTILAGKKLPRAATGEVLPLREYQSEERASAS